jgi:hypothetical protein
MTVLTGCPGKSVEVLKGYSSSIGSEKECDCLTEKENDEGVGATQRREGQKRRCNCSLERAECSDQRRDHPRLP